MNFWQIFIRVVWWRPLAALEALWWQLTRRRVRARNRLRAAGAQLPFAYKFWMRNIEQPQQMDERASAAPQTWTSHPTFTVVIDARERTIEALATSIRSVEEQVYSRPDIIIVAPDAGPPLARADSVMAALEQSQGEFIVPVVAGNQLSKWALFYFAEALQSCAGAAILYGDEDEVDGNCRRRRPWFKPRWNRELFLARDYLSRACAIRTSMARAGARRADLEDSTWVLDVLLNVIAKGDGPVVHVPKIVAHVPDIDAQVDQAARVKVIGRHVAAVGGRAAAGPFDSVKVSWPLPDPLPLVSVIVPTRDKLELLSPCVESLLHSTRYERFELVIVDNESVEPRALRYLDQLRHNERVRVISYPHTYNYSAINNHAAREARGTFLCLLNNDTEVIDGDWLTEMMRYAVRPEVGAVGAKLLYADGTIQHAGVIVGIGEAAGHAHRNLRGDKPGYFCQAQLPHFVSAVTGACLLVDKRKFLAVDGLDEGALPIAYNDVDLCLKLERAGWRNAYVPHSVLIHHESKSRAKDHAPSRIESYTRELHAFQKRWGTKNYDDPLLNPNLDRSSETFVIRF